LPLAGPAVIIVSGCLIAMLSFGRARRSAVSDADVGRPAWDRNVFSALAIQNILWGAGRRLLARLPTSSARSGSFRRRYSRRTVCGWMATSTSPAMLDLGAGVLDRGLAGCSFSLVIGAFALVPDRRMFAFGAERRRIVRSVSVLRRPPLD
jgi:hypothetical protein